MRGQRGLGVTKISELSTGGRPSAWNFGERSLETLSNPGAGWGQGGGQGNVSVAL